jgi:outer membrane lipoprotein-sorting protein
MKPVNNIDKRIGRLQRQAGDGLNERVHKDIDRVLADRQTVAHSRMRRTIMTSPITRLAAAAAVILAGLLGLNVLDGPHAGGVAWGQIPDRVKAIDTFLFRLTMSVQDKSGTSIPNEPTAQFTFYLSERYGFRMDIRGDGTVVSWYVPPEGDTLTMVVPREKKWSRTPLPPEARGRMPEEYQDPADYIKRFMARPYKQLGRSILGGVEVEGIEVTDPPTDGEKLQNAIGRMWVDVRTELPVQIEIEGTANGKIAQWLMEFQWSEAVDPKVFEFNIPGDYTPMAG